MHVQKVETPPSSHQLLAVHREAELLVQEEGSKAKVLVQG